MAGNEVLGSINSASDKKAAKASGKKEIKILMLHGYTQSGSLFRAKTRAVEKLLQKHLAPFNFFPTCLYPTAPNRLLPGDIPGYEAPAPTANDEGPADVAEPEAWAWFRKDEAAGSYRFFREGMTSLAAAIAAAGGVDGVVGFSQGGAMAALLASALETPARSPAASDGDCSWLGEVRAANAGRPLRFAAVYSGFFAPPAELQWMYEPHIKTPTLHFLGSLDTVVEEKRSRALIAKCVNPIVVVHPGGHYVPVSKEWVLPLVGFIKKSCEDDAEETASGDD